MNRKTSTMMSLGISIALIAVGIWFLCNHQNDLGYGRRGWIMPYHMTMVGGGMGIVTVLFWVAVLSAIGLMVSGVISSHRSSNRQSSDTLSAKLKSRNQRNARGRIDESRYETMKSR